MLPWVLAQQHLGHALARGAGRAQALHVVLAVEVLADGDELHLGRDEAAARVVHLGHVGTRAGAARLALQAGKAQRRELGVGGALAPKGAAQATEQIAVGALLDPALAQRGQAAADVDRRRRVAIGAGTVIDEDGRIRLGPQAGRGVGLADLAHGHLHIGARAGHVDFARIGQRRDGGLVHLGGAGQKGFGRSVHGRGFRKGLGQGRHTPSQPAFADTPEHGRSVAQPHRCRSRPGICPRHGRHSWAVPPGCLVKSPQSFAHLPTGVRHEPRPPRFRL